MIFTFGGSEISGLTLYLGGQPVQHFHKDYDLINLARQCLMGQITLPTNDPVRITDHGTLLALAEKAISIARLSGL